ncbi:hypothetical protein [Sphingomonas xanthus]|uniref:Uncharacterized protein n=1 Tax=Sphingomonas xanthus TaxID=2594473 RepID=A0A516IT49_9SPHN|nr:hypothetical protein [Sphingomonas xanthus]QDP20036.1 hypothetical protein FMM02_08750 [Sphingomonas xanthus]
MAKAKSAGEGPKKKKAKDAAKTKPAPKKRATKKAEHRGFDALAKMADHPLVADLLAVGAMAAVAAIAEQGFSSKEAGKKGGGSSRAVKAAGQAAAMAIGKRLITEFEAVKKDSKKA